MQTEQIFLYKTFELVDQLTAKIHSHSIDVLYIPTSREINISRAISSLCSLGVPLNNCQIFYQDFQRKVYAYIGNFPFKKQIYLKYELFLDNVIKIRFKKITGESGSTVAAKGAAGNSNQAETHKKKIKERTIRQASEYIKQWRNLYELVDNNGKRIYTLETAANKVGLAKKTLDDYYFQLRQAQKYGFKFQEHKNDKIGVLRSFVRQNIKQQLLKSQAKASKDEIDRYLNFFSSDSDEERRNK